MTVSDDARSDDDHADFHLPKSPAHSDEFDIVQERKSGLTDVELEYALGHSRRRRRRRTGPSDAHTQSEAFASEGEDGRQSRGSGRQTSRSRGSSSEKSEPFGHEHHHAGFHDGLSDHSAFSGTNSDFGGPGEHAPENLHSALLRIHELEEWIKSLEETKSQLSSRVRELQDHRNRRFDAQDSPEVLLSRIHDLEAKLRSSEAANAKLSTSLNAESLRSRALEERCRPLEDTIAEVSASLDTATSRVRELEAVCKGEPPEALLTKTHELEEKLRDLEIANKELLASGEVSAARARELEERCGSLEAARAELAASCAKMASRCEELEERCRQREIANKELSACFDLTSSRVRELEERCRPLEASNAQLSASLNAASKNVRELEERYQRIEQVLAQKEEDNRILQSRVGGADRQTQDAKTVRELEDRCRTMQHMLTQTEGENRRLQARMDQAFQPDASAQDTETAEPTAQAEDGTEQRDATGQESSSKQAENSLKVLYVGLQRQLREDGGASDGESESSANLTRREARRRQKILRRWRGGQEETQSIGEEASEDDAPQREPSSREPESAAPETTDASAPSRSAARWHHGVGLVSQLGGALNMFFDDGSAETEDAQGVRARRRRRQNREVKVGSPDAAKAETAVQQDDSGAVGGDAKRGCVDEESSKDGSPEALSSAASAPVARHDGASIRRLQNVLGAIHNSIGAKPASPGMEIMANSMPPHEPNQAKEKLEACISQLGKGDNEIKRLTEKLNIARQRLKEKADVMNRQRASLQARSLTLPPAIASEIHLPGGDNLQQSPVPNDAG